MAGQLLCECSAALTHPDAETVGRTSRRRRAVSPTHVYAAPIPRDESYKLVAGERFVLFDDEPVAVCWSCVQAGHVAAAS